MEDRYLKFSSSLLRIWHFKWAFFYVIPYESTE